MIELNKIVWAIATILIISSGVYFTSKLNFIQFRMIKNIKLLFREKKPQKGITAFESLFMSLGARIGVGSLAGIALAIYKGGPGSVFWIIATVFIVAPNAFSESVLSVIYRKKESKDVYIGGPAHYIKGGLGKKKLASVYALIIIISYIFGFLTIQANTIVKAVELTTLQGKLAGGLVIAILTLFIIINGVRGIVKVTAKLVPFMSLVFLSAALYIIIKNIDEIPGIISMVINEALNIKAFGYGIIASFIIGLQRSIFSNEAGLGTSAIASATANVKYPTSQGIIQIIGVYFTTLVICLATALVILTSEYQGLTFIDMNGIELTSYAMNYHLGTLGTQILTFSIILFAFSTIITGYYYGESNLKFLFNNISKNKIKLFKMLVVSLLVVGSIISSTILWQVVDLLVAIIAIINIYALFSLRKDVINEWRSSGKKRK